ncbi:MAG TPA: DUF4434 domain-containing protein [Candidatus Wallbacteria bacterium]|nr:DUF4434 domain-containing protein [Candidatus Wallbacteria bacterium]
MNRHFTLKIFLAVFLLALLTIAGNVSAQNEAEKQAGCSPFITGAFFQFAEGHNDETQYPVEYWLKELEAMKAIGMDTAIIQFNQTGKANFSEATERFLTAADQCGMRVFIGTSLNEGPLWYTVDKINPIKLALESKAVAKYTTILIKQFKPHESFIGVYIPYEDNTFGIPGAVGDFYAGIVKAVKAEDPKLLTMISPFTCLQPGRAVSLPKFALELYFKTMLSKAKVDICAWQDGVGGTKDQLSKFDKDLGAISKICNELGIEVWSNAEVFHRTTPLSKDFEAESTDFETMKSQITGAQKYVSKIICFDFNHYLSPNIGSNSAKTLYDKYKSYYDEACSAGNAR